MENSKNALSRIGHWANGHQTTILRWWFFIWLAYEVIFCLAKIQGFYKWNYKLFVISEWMINYQGGFVRRGIVGEALWRLWQVHHFPLAAVIFGIVIVSMAAMLILLYRLFKRDGWSMVLLPSCLLLLPAFSCTLGFARKDYIMLLAVFLLYHLYANFQNCTRHRLWPWVAMQVVGILLLLIHEAAFFFTIPCMMMYAFMHQYRNQGDSAIRSAVVSIAQFAPILVAMAAVCCFKGNGDAAQSIWASWRPVMAAFPQPTDVDTSQPGRAVEFLNYGMLPTFKSHLIKNFSGWFWHALYLPSFPFTIYCWVAAYYCVTRMQTVDLKFNVLKKIDTVLLSNIVIFQFVMMLPMFTILSCDGGRTVPYWIISSLFLYHFFGKRPELMPRFLSRLSSRVQAWIDRKRILCNPWFYFFVLWSMPLIDVGGSSIAAYHWVTSLITFFGFTI